MSFVIHNEPLSMSLLFNRGTLGDIQIAWIGLVTRRNFSHNPNFAGGERAWRLSLIINGQRFNHSCLHNESLIKTYSDEDWGSLLVGEHMDRTVAHTDSTGQRFLWTLWDLALHTSPCSCSFLPFMINYNCKYSAFLSSESF